MPASDGGFCNGDSFCRKTNSTKAEMSELTSQTVKEGNRKLLDSKPFSVSARVAMQVGRESISSSVTAILELVKNAYDADASLIRIRFQGIGTGGARLVIEDDGRGMTIDDLRN